LAEDIDGPEERTKKHRGSETSVSHQQREEKKGKEHPSATISLVTTKEITQIIEGGKSKERRGNEML